MLIIEKIRQDLKMALKTRDKATLTALRYLMSQLHNREIALTLPSDKFLPDEEANDVLRQQVKQRKESMTAFTQGGRNDLVEKERAELEILNKYLPQQLSEQEVEKIVQETIREVGVSGMADFGKVMGAVMGRVNGRADGATVSEVVKKLVGNSKIEV